jgi:D-serine deaminase-like pyridoxal phosphate-dependent protein
VHIDDKPTPQVLIDRARLDRNIAAMQAAATARGLRLRPHAKTHKSPHIARLQLAAGAVGICCAKLGEAEVFADAGIADIRLPYPVHPSNASRVVALLDRVRLSIIVDHADVARAWSEAMVRSGRTLDVLVKVDVGFHRCGIDPARVDAAAFVQRVAGLPNLRFRGLLSHAGHGYHAHSQDELREIAVREAGVLGELRSRVESDGVEVSEVSVGATPTARFSVAQPGVTEMRPGNYVYFDRTQVALGAATIADCALSVYATVVSKPAPDRLIFDCGSKTLAADVARGFVPPPGHAAVLEAYDSLRVDDSLLVERLSEEHATVRVLSGHTGLEPGDRVRLVPNHACVVSNLVDEVCLMEGPTIIEILPVAARGKIA